jgi:hypothetical protein
VFQVVNNRTSTRSMAFTYDPVNRIASAQSSGPQWGETFNIDSWGNLTGEGALVQIKAITSTIPTQEG